MRPKDALVKVHVVELSSALSSINNNNISIQPTFVHFLAGF